MNETKKEAIDYNLIAVKYKINKAYPLEFIFFILYQGNKIQTTISQSIKNITIHDEKRI